MTCIWPIISCKVLRLCILSTIQDIYNWMWGRCTEYYIHLPWSMYIHVWQRLGLQVRPALDMCETASVKTLVIAPAPILHRVCSHDQGHDIYLRRHRHQMTYMHSQDSITYPNPKPRAWRGGPAYGLMLILKLYHLLAVPPWYSSFYLATDCLQLTSPGKVFMPNSHAYCQHFRNITSARLSQVCFVSVPWELTTKRG